MPNIWDILFGKKVHVAPASHQVENKTKHTIDSDAIKGAGEENNALADALSGVGQKHNSVPQPTVNTYTPHDGYIYTLGDKYAQKVQDYFDDVPFVQVKVIYERNSSPYEVVIVWRAVDNKKSTNPNKPLEDAFAFVQNRFDDDISLKLSIERKNKATILIGGK